MSDIKANDGNAVRQAEATQEAQFGEPWIDFYTPIPGSARIMRNDGPGSRMDEATDIEFDRAQACVNAMAGIEDPQGFVREARELLHRCEGFVDWYNEAPDHPVGAPLLKDIRAMLARLDAGRGK